MITVSHVEYLVESLRSQFRSDSFEYADPILSFSGVVRRHFSGGNQQLYGVYLVRKRETRELLYVGKGGTINASGKMKAQDLRGRLINVKDGSTSADVWFRSLVEECGPLLIEYIVTDLPITPPSSKPNYCKLSWQKISACP